MEGVQEVAQRLRELVHQTIPGVEERIQYKKPHFLKNGKYAAVISPSRDAVTFMIMNTAGLDVPAGFDGPPERKSVKIRAGQTPDYALLGGLLSQAVSGL